MYIYVYIYIRIYNHHYASVSHSGTAQKKSSDTTEFLLSSPDGRIHRAAQVLPGQEADAVALRRR